MRRSLHLLLLVVLMTASSSSSHAAPPPADPALWLEEVTGEPALKWVRQQNDLTTGELANTPEFKTMSDRFLVVLARRAAARRLRPVARRGHRRTRAAVGAAAERSHHR